MRPQRPLTRTFLFIDPSAERTSDKYSSPVLPDYKESRVGPGTVGPPFASSSPPPRPSLL
jgi:hypothetical protein